MNQKKIHFFFPNLDGLRFLCFLSVFMFHSFFTDFDYIKNSSFYHFIKVQLFGNGNIGVNFFFVLSGFLITFLLIKEKEFQGQITITKFWVRRILRIWPLYFFCVFFGFVIFPVLKHYFGQQPNETANPIYYITFLNNFDFIKKGLPDASVLGVLWSVAIEEQFYFIWPVLLFLIPNKWYPYLFAIIFSVSLVFRAYYDNALYNEYHTLSCMGDLCMGACGAYFVQNERNIERIKRWSKSFLLILYISFVIVFLFRSQLFYNNYVLRLFERPFIAFIILLIILEQNYSNISFFKMGKAKLISKLGTISYGLYCLHFIGILIVITITRKFHLNTSVFEVIFIEMPLSLAITVLISFISFNKYESYFLKLKERFSYITK